MTNSLSSAEIFARFLETGIKISTLLIANILIFHFLKGQLGRSRENVQLTLAKQQLENQKQYFTEMIENQKRSNEAIHDVKNQLLAILGYIEDGQIKQAVKYLNEVSDNISGDITFIKTGHIAIDSLLNAKIARINSLNIDIQTTIFMGEKNQIGDLDLCIILGNALDNATEACEKIKEGPRKIKLKVVQVDDYLSITIINSTAGKIRIKNNKIHTTKKDKLFHGYGLKNIKEIVLKHGGHVDYEQIDNIFTIRILLINPADDQM